MGYEWKYTTPENWLNVNDLQSNRSAAQAAADFGYGITDPTTLEGLLKGQAPTDYLKNQFATKYKGAPGTPYITPDGRVAYYTAGEKDSFTDFSVPITFAAMIASAGAASAAMAPAAAGAASAGAGAGAAAGASGLVDGLGAAAAGYGGAEAGAGAFAGSGLVDGLGAAADGYGGAAAGGSTFGGSMDLGDWQDWGSMLDSGGSSLEPAGGWGDTQSLGQMVENGGTWGTQSGGKSLFDQIKEVYNRVPSGTQQAIKALMNSGDSNGLMSLLGKLGAAGLGAYASNQQSGALADLARKYAEMGAPSRARFEASMQPGFDPMSIPGYAGAVDTASKGLLARLSATGGNPFGNPAGLVQANKDIISGTALPAISDYQRTNLAGGGLANLNAAVPTLDTASINKAGDVYSSLGYGLNAITNPQPSLADQIRALNLQGLA